VVLIPNIKLILNCFTWASN